MGMFDGWVGTTKVYGCQSHLTYVSHLHTYLLHTQHIYNDSKRYIFIYGHLSDVQWHHIGGDCAETGIGAGAGAADVKTEFFGEIHFNNLCEHMFYGFKLLSFARFNVCVHFQINIFTYIIIIP